MLANLLDFGAVTVDDVMTPRNQIHAVDLHAKPGILVSNHSNAVTHQLYKGAKIQEFEVRRSISCKTALREQVLELLALYN